MGGARNDERNSDQHAAQNFYVGCVARLKCSKGILLFGQLQIFVDIFNNCVHIKCVNKKILDSASKLPVLPQTSVISRPSGTVISIPEEIRVGIN